MLYPATLKGYPVNCEAFFDTSNLVLETRSLDNADVESEFEKFALKHPIEKNIALYSHIIDSMGSFDFRFEGKMQNPLYRLTAEKIVDYAAKAKEPDGFCYGLLRDISKDNSWKTFGEKFLEAIVFHSSEARIEERLAGLCYVATSLKNAEKTTILNADNIAVMKANITAVLNAETAILNDEVTAILNADNIAVLNDEITAFLKAEIIAVLNADKTAVLEDVELINPLQLRAVEEIILNIPDEPKDQRQKMKMAKVLAVAATYAPSKIADHVQALFLEATEKLGPREKHIVYQYARTLDHEGSEMWILSNERLYSLKNPSRSKHTVYGARERAASING